MKHHELKTDKQYFEAVESGSKTFEIRRNDRNYQVGDLLTLRETENTAYEMSDGAPLEYTGRELTVELTYVMDGYSGGAVRQGWSMLGFKPVITFSDTTEEIQQNLAADAEHLNCPACGGSGHIDDTTPAAQSDGWISIEVQWPERTDGSKILAYGNGYVFECECDQDGEWCSLGGEEFTHWKPYSAPIQPEQEAV